ncbi:TetR/AcrR family transcriptional regulator [Streptomyces sp. XM4193]|uniref:TetR/AcrR family transcriptional regulator n=1 Tax=Streptomyces sp. XM4193 TaxID=2929782 RepID=UPI001FFA39B9|nr:TetR/AcrR family transcriptional regulator [Streptomyces sp. XM4193]MCK1795781.1 TetR/AcrR family transcriptional regulator [Streptomyces sp. XM4193]
MRDQPSHKDLPAAAAGGASDGLRIDARYNRERILRAAREAYTAHGIDVPVATIARRAGVGVATVYRRFPTRASLVTAAFSRQLSRCVGVLDEALADPDPWHGFCTLIEQVCAMQAADRGFTEAFLSEFPDSGEFGRERDRADEGLARLVRAAKGTGKLRADFEVSDVVLLLRANCGVVGDSAPGSTAASRRLVAYFLHSFRAEHAEPLPPPAPLDLPGPLRSRNGNAGGRDAGREGSAGGA